MKHPDRGGSQSAKLCNNICANLHLLGVSDVLVNGANWQHVTI
jgi:3-hydroxyisobutyrate dehydrogenase-like beta-hydroxyacid dehydrogenase